MFQYEKIFSDISHLLMFDQLLNKIILKVLTTTNSYSLYKHYSHTVINDLHHNEYLINN